MRRLEYSQCHATVLVITIFFYLKSTLTRIYLHEFYKTRPLHSAENQTKVGQNQLDSTTTVVHSVVALLADKTSRIFPEL